MQKLLENMQKLKDEIREKKRQMKILEQRMIGSVETSPCGPSIVEMSQALSRLATQLNEKTYELEIKSADNRVLQEQLREKTLEAAEMQETISVLRQQNSSADSITTRVNSSEYSLDNKNGRGYDLNSCDETSTDESTPTSVVSLNRSVFGHGTAKECTCDAKSQLLAQAVEIESLKQDKLRLVEDQDGLEIHCQKQTDEASYAKELAAAAAVELRNLAEEVTKLSYQNAQLTADLAAATNTQCKAKCRVWLQRCVNPIPVLKRPDNRLEFLPFLMASLEPNSSRLKKVNFLRSLMSRKCAINLKEEGSNMSDGLDLRSKGSDHLVQCIHIIVHQVWVLRWIRFKGPTHFAVVGRIPDLVIVVHLSQVT